MCVSGRGGSRSRRDHGGQAAPPARSRSRGEQLVHLRVLAARAGGRRAAPCRVTPRHRPPGPRVPPRAAGSSPSRRARARPALSSADGGVRIAIRVRSVSALERNSAARGPGCCGSSRCWVRRDQPLAPATRAYQVSDSASGRCLARGSTGPPKLFMLGAEAALSAPKAAGAAQPRRVIAPVPDPLRARRQRTARLFTDRRPRVRGRSALRAPRAPVVALRRGVIAALHSTLPGVIRLPFALRCREAGAQRAGPSRASRAR